MTVLMSGSDGCVSVASQLSSRPFMKTAPSSYSKLVMRIRQKKLPEAPFQFHLSCSLKSELYYKNWMRMRILLPQSGDSVPRTLWRPAGHCPHVHPLFLQLLPPITSSVHQHCAVWIRMKKTKRSLKTPLHGFCQLWPFAPISCWPPLWLSPADAGPPSTCSASLRLTLPAPWRKWVFMRSDCPVWSL